MKKRDLAALTLTAVMLTGCASGTGPSGSISTSASGAANSGFVQGNPAVGIWTDWSRLEGERTGVQPDTDGGRWYPERTDHLTPGENYGPLVPYLGEIAYPFQRWGGEMSGTPAYWSDWTISFYGLMTREGKIVVDPVYQSAHPYSYRWQGEDLALPVLILARSDPDWAEANSGRRYAVAAEDGSWITDFEFVNYTNQGDQLLLLSPQGVTQLDSATGARKDWTWEELEVSETDVPETLEFIQWGIGWTWTEHGAALGTKPLKEDEHGVPMESIPVRVFQPETGEVFWVEGQQWDAWYDEYFSNQRWAPGWELTQEGDQVTLSFNGETYVIPDAPPNCSPYMPQVQDGLVILDYDSGSRLRRLSDGEVLLEGGYIQFVSDPLQPGRLGCVAVRNGANYTIYDSDLTPILTFPLAREDDWLWFRLRNGLLSCDDDSTWFGCWDMDAGTYIFYRNLYPGD